MADGCSANCGEFIFCSQKMRYASKKPSKVNLLAFDLHCTFTHVGGQLNIELEFAIHIIDNRFQVARHLNAQ